MNMMEIIIKGDWKPTENGGSWVYKNFIVYIDVTFNEWDEDDVTPNDQYHGLLVFIETGNSNWSDEDLDDHFYNETLKDKYFTIDQVKLYKEEL